MTDFHPTPMCDIETATAWDAARDELLALAQLAIDWDGEGADPVKPGLISASLWLMEKAMEYDYPPPVYVYATADGTVMIEWHWANGRGESTNVRKPNSAEIVYREPGQKPTFEVLRFGTEPELPNTAPVADSVAFGAFHSDAPHLAA